MHSSDFSLLVPLLKLVEQHQYFDVFKPNETNWLIPEVVNFESENHFFRFIFQNYCRKQSWVKWAVNQSSG